jgi:hypothetical protein
VVDRHRPRRIRFSLPTRAGRVHFHFQVTSGDSTSPDLAPPRARVNREVILVIALGFLFFGVLLNYIAVKSLLLAVRGVETTAWVTEVVPSARIGVPPTVRVWFADRQRRTWTGELHPTDARTVGRQVQVVYDRDNPAAVEDARHRYREPLRMLGFAAVWWLMAPWVLMRESLGLRVPRQARPVALAVGALVVLVWFVVLLLR